MRESIKNAEKDLKEYQRLDAWQPKPKAVQPPFKNIYADLEESNETLAGFVTGQVKRGSLRQLGLMSARMTYTQAPPMPASPQELIPEDPSIPYKALIAAAKSRLDWMKDVEQAIVEYGGKTAKELNPAYQEEDVQAFPFQIRDPIRLLPILPTTVDTSKSNALSGVVRIVPLQYKVYRSMNYSDLVASHLTDLYAQLFEACWKGDTHAVEKLCLPPKSGKRDKNATYLHVTAEVVPTFAGIGGNTGKLL